MLSVVSNEKDEIKDKYGGVVGHYGTGLVYWNQIESTTTYDYHFYKLEKLTNCVYEIKIVTATISVVLEIDKETDKNSNNFYKGRLLLWNVASSVSSDSLSICSLSSMSLLLNIGEFSIVYACLSFDNSNDASCFTF